MTPQKSLAEYLPTIEELPAALARIDNADTLLADESMVVPTELIEGVLHKGLKAVIGGSSKACKTWSLLDVAIFVSTGGRWLNHRRQQARCSSSISKFRAPLFGSVWSR